MQPFIKNYLGLLIVGLGLSACSIEDVIPEPTAPQEVQYTINQGAHETSNSFKTIKAKKIKFSVKFDKSAEYSTKEPNNQADINKLYGMADCSSFHHDNSARFGWRWYKGRLEILAYTYKGGVNTSTLITAISIDKWYTCEISMEDGKYVFQVGNKKVEHPRGCDGEASGYRLYPYFGGDETAPHKINIMVKDEN